MKVIGLTGGIASGKSLIAKWFLEEKIDILDSDKIYKQLLKNNEILYNKIVNHFGDEFVLENKELNLSKLGVYVFSHKDELEKLNEITHPFVLQEIDERILFYNKKKVPIIILDIPLLFEAKLEYLCNEIICVYVDSKTQLDRLIERDNIEKEYALKKISSQMDLDTKANLADYVIDNSNDIKDTRKQFDEILKLLRSEINVN